MKKFVLALLISAAWCSYGHAADVSTKDTFQTKLDDTTVTANPFSGAYIGWMAGAQFNDITITDPDSGEYVSGISADGLVTGPFAGWSFCSGRICFGPRVEYAWTDVGVHLGELGDVVKQDTYAQLTAELSAQVGKTTQIGVHAGYEWQFWSLDRQLSDALRLSGDIDMEAVVIGASIETLLWDELSFTFRADYLIYDAIEVDGAPAGFNAALEDALKDSDALRVKAGVAYRPRATSSLVNLDTWRGF